MPEALGSWEVQRGRPHPGLRPHVISYTGYAEYARAPLRRMEVPTTTIPLIVSLGPSLLVNGERHESFAAGIDDAVVITEYAGEQLGIEVNVTPLGARRLLGLPMSELTRRVVPLDALLGPRLPELIERLNAAPDWAARFALLDAALLARLQHACGYADQAHLNRDFRAFAGTTPTDYVARLLPDGAGVAAGEFPNVQDGLARAA